MRAGRLIVLVLALAAAPFARAAATEEAAPTTYYEIPGTPSTETLRFWTAHWLKDGTLKDTGLTFLVVHLEGAKERPAGVSYILIDQRIDCASQAVTTISYAAYAEDGTLVSKTAILPSEGAAFTSGPWIDGRWHVMCLIANTPAPRPGDPLPPPTPPVQLQGAMVTSIPAALAVARQRGAEIEHAYHLPEEGSYAIIDFPPVAALGITLVDFSTYDRTSPTLKFSWLYVRNPTVESPTHYLRATFTVDCTKGTAAREIIARFDINDRLIQLDGAKKPAPFVFTEAPALLDRACTLEKPGFFSIRGSHSTFSSALSYARRMLAR